MPQMNLYEHAVRAIIFADSPERKRKSRDETLGMSLLPRSIVHAGYLVISHCPNVAQKALFAPYSVLGLNVVGFGCNSTVISQGLIVSKLVRGSRAMTAEQRTALVQDLAWRHQIAKEYLGSACVDQTVDIIPHPIRRVPIVATHQPYIPFNPYRAGSTCPSVAQQALLADFGRRSEQMEKDTGLVSDVAGLDNFGFDDSGKLVIVDTFPMKGNEGGPSVVYARQLLASFAELDSQAA